MDKQSHWVKMTAAPVALPGVRDAIDNGFSEIVKTLDTPEVVEIVTDGETRRIVLDGSEWHRGNVQMQMNCHCKRKQFIRWMRSPDGFLALYNMRKEARVFIRCQEEGEFTELWP